MSLRLLLTALGVILSALCVDMFSQGLPLRQITNVSGLPNNYIAAIFKDSRGFIWIGSSTGLFRYDGYSARCVADMTGKYSSVLSEQIMEIQEDSRGRLWVKGETSQAIFDPHSNTIINGISDYIKQYGITSFPTTVRADMNGDIWIATEQDGLYRLNIQENEAEKASAPFPMGSPIVSFAIHDSKIISATRSATLLETDPNNMKTRVLAQSPADYQEGKFNLRLYVDRKGRLWLFSTDGMMLYDLRNAEWQNHLLPSGGKVGVVKDIYHDSKDNLWLARDHHGIERIEFINGGYRISKVKTEGSLNPEATVSSIMEDKYGTIFFGTYKMGLFFHDETVNKFSLLRLPSETGMPDVNCMLTSADGDVLVGTDSSGLWRWDPATGIFEPIPDISEDADKAITCMASRPDRPTFLGKFAKGLFDFSEGRVRRMSTGTDIDRSYIWSMAFDRNGVLWIGTLGNGVFSYDLEKNIVKNFTSANSGLKTDFVVSILPSIDGKIYFGTSLGIVCHEPSERTMFSIPIDSEPTISASKVTDIYEDTHGLLWLATSSGLKLLDRKKNHVFSILPQAKDVFGIMEDNSGDIWISNGSRLTEIKVNYQETSSEPQVFTRVYDKRTGLQDCDFNQRSFTKLKDGSLALGGPYGITWFNPSDIKIDSNRPTVMFTDLYMDGKPVNAGETIEGRVPLRFPITTEGRLEFNHNPKEFTVFFATDNYALPEKTRFKYRLDGYNDQWSELPEGVNHVTYTNLSPGTYRLLVTAINEDGFESEHPASIEIKVHHSFWGSPWGTTIYVFLAIICTCLIVKIARHIERDVQKRHNQELTRRKQEELNQMKFRFFTNVSHDLRTPLTLILAPLEDMLNETTDEHQTKRLNIMHNNARRLLSLVDQLLDFRKSETSDLQFNPSEGDIVAFTRNVCNSFLSLSDRKDINLTFYSEKETIEMLFDEDKMEKILMNLLGNAFKFTPAGGRIDVSIGLNHSDNSILRIQISDTGIGISDEDKEHIFERFFQVESGGEHSHTAGSGIGLSMVSEYVSMHAGKIKVTDNVERGSVFIIDIPYRVSRTGAEDKPGKEIASDTCQDDTQKEPAMTKMDTDAERKKILVADDIKDMTEMLKDSLESSYDIITASDGKEALKIAKQRKPDLILTDLMMPVMDGIELCRTLKEDPETRNIPVVIITAKHDLGMKLEGLSIGADDYITKPFNIDVLRLRIRHLIGHNAKMARRTLINPEPDHIEITPLDEKLMDKAMKYVSQHINKPELTVEELSDYMGMSRVTLYKKIKQITGKTPLEFIRVIRIKRAAQLLRESQLNVSEIAYQVGFNNPKIFARYFKEEFGILPSAYQEKEGI